MQTFVKFSNRKKELIIEIRMRRLFRFPCNSGRTMRDLAFDSYLRCISLFHLWHVEVRQTILSIACRRFCLRTRKRSRPSLRGHSLERRHEELLSPYSLSSVEVPRWIVRRYREPFLCKKSMMPNTENRKTVLS